MQKALFVISSLQGGGAQRVMTTMANGLVGRGRDVTLVTIDDQESSFFPLDERVKRIDLAGNTRLPPVLSRLGPVGRFINRMQRLRRVLLQVGPDVAVSFLTRTNIQLVLAAKGIVPRVVISERNDPGIQDHGLHWRILRRLCYRQAHVITANSRGVIQALQGYVPEDKLVYTPNPLQMPDETAVPDQEEPFVLIVGRLHHQKAHDVLLRAFSMLGPDLGKWRLRIVGDGELRKDLVSHAEKLGISERVDWIGQTEDVNAHYKKAAIFVMPSRYEGTPNALLEAMSYGLPVIVSNASSGPLELVGHDQTGLVIPAADPHSLAQALERLMSDPGLRQRLGLAARQRVFQFDEEEILDLWEVIFNKGCCKD